MQKGKSIREHVAEYLEEHPGSLMWEIQCAILQLGISSNFGVASVIRNMSACGALEVDKTNYKAFRYSLKEEARAVYLVDASRFEVPPELAGPAVPPLVWSMRHLLGHAV
ncbi:hypothetical protein E2K99_10345 [Herbaspirillum huttiense]|uniref:hypothetical protein n=1 Tax=Herbaspirillum huttiense TaxID=863372 RepID=UPI0010658215|nr:hypothetical protein [Herbaspirillum huttiense]QBP75386.1 hypothetical protein E2K99_10345 [Herbaspirillum huttiense]